MCRELRKANLQTNPTCYKILKYEINVNTNFDI